MFRRVRSLLHRLAEAPPQPVAPPRPAPPPLDRDPVDTTLAYHRRTRHAPAQPARALPYMDWDTQPDPFRVFEGAPRVALDLAPPGDDPPYEPCFLLGSIPARPLDRASLSQLLQDALGLSAWKVAGEARWSLRVNPSSGNLHPTEGYAITGAIDGLCGPGLYHYQPYEHALEQRRALGEAATAAIEALAPGGLLVGLSSIVLRESWKYGERAFRYCQHDLGHAIAAIAVAASALGWRVRLVEGVSDAALAALLGTDAQEGIEAEIPECLLAVTPVTSHDTAIEYRPLTLDPALLTGPLLGQPRALAEDHHPWPVLDEVARATVRHEPPPLAFWAEARPENRALSIGDAPFGLRRIVHQRRSAVDMDGTTGITAATFFQMLIKCLAGRDQVPFETLPWTPGIDLLLYVHRVSGLLPGQYALVRDSSRLDSLRAALDPSFTWEPPPGCPEGLALYLLQAGDARATASGTSCGQAIAADGCFAVAMLAELGPALRAHGAWFYRRLHWEAGAVGQVLYLEAEASGVRGTGIGCFYDLSSARAFGLRDDEFAVLYHFTLGGPVEDSRLGTEPAYGHLKRAAST